MPTIQEVLRALLGGGRGDIELGKDGELPRIPHEPLRPFSMGANPPPSQLERAKAAFYEMPEPRTRDIELPPERRSREAGRKSRR